jgi:hypothetical protein
MPNYLFNLFNHQSLILCLSLYHSNCSATYFTFTRWTCIKFKNTQVVTDSVTQVCVHNCRSWKMTNFGEWALWSSKLLRAQTPRGSSSLKQVLLVQFKIWEFTRNLYFPMIQFCCAIFVLKVSMALLTAAWCIISLAWVLGRPTFKDTACTSCEISDYQTHATVAKTAKILGSAVNAISCPHSKNERVTFWM